MTRSLSYLFGIIITIVLGMILYFTLCSDCQIAVAEKEEISKELIPEPDPDPTSMPFAFSSGDFGYSVVENFNFKSSSGEFEIPVSLQVNKGVAELKNFLSAHPKKTFTITGLYSSNEMNPTAWPNLGMARANSIKNYLVGLGIPSSQTITRGRLMENLVPTNDLFLGPVTYEIGERDNNSETELKSLYEKIKANPLILYFNTGEAAINLNSEQRQKIADISRYLDLASNATCSVIGYTDNVGKRETNIRLGKERADFAKAFLTQNGILKSKITTSSMGPDNPITSNETEEGRAKNRRTVVTIN